MNVKKCRIRNKLIMMFLLTVVFTAISTPVLAAKNLQFNATNVYFSSNQQNTLIVEGTFVNTGDEYINTVNPTIMSVSVLTGNEWRTASATFKNTQINLPAGASIGWIFYLHNTSYISFSRWHVETDCYY